MIMREGCQHCQIAAQGCQLCNYGPLRLSSSIYMYVFSVLAQGCHIWAVGPLRRVPKLFYWRSWALYLVWRDNQFYGGSFAVARRGLSSDNHFLNLPSCIYAVPRNDYVILNAGNQVKFNILDNVNWTRFFEMYVTLSRHLFLHCVVTHSCKHVDSTVVNFTGPSPVAPLRGGAEPRRFSLHEILLRKSSIQQVNGHEF